MFHSENCANVNGFRCAGDIRQSAKVAAKKGGVNVFGVMSLSLVVLCVILSVM